jgi:transposase, IS30 family
MPIMVYTRLSLSEREEISRHLAGDAGANWSAIGLALGRHRSTVQREVDRHGGRHRYRAGIADRAARRTCGRVAKLVADVGLGRRVRERLVAGYSPAGTARLVGGIAAETIYRAIYAGTLDVTARDVLRTRRHRRRPRGQRRGRANHFLGQFTSIHQRPAAVNDRSEFGHWEGDLIIGARNRTALVTLCERLSRRQVILDLPAGYRAEPTADRLASWIQTMPHPELRSLTWDRGSEMADWAGLAVAYGLDVYFCDPHSPWQRGQNEHQNRQLRYWLPKSTDLGVHTRSDLDRICAVLNTQPRRSLNWHSPNHVYAAHSAH